jgi:hypothetical protein
MKTETDNRWLINLSIVLIVITTIPYVTGYLMESQEWKFTGFLFGVEDGNSYIAKMLNGASGEWLFRTPYTAAEQKGMVAFLPYILMGKIVSAPGSHDQLVSIFHLFRWLSIFLYVIASNDFVSNFLKDRFQRRAAVAVICAGSGLGWLYFIGLNGFWGDSLPLEFYSPETFGFLELFGLPHLAVARALLLWGLSRLIQNLEQPWKRKEISKAGAIWFGMGLFQPMLIAIGWALAVVLLVWRLIQSIKDKKSGDLNARRQVIELARRTVIIIAASSIWVLYNSTVFLTDAYASIWMKQNILLSPSPLSYLLAYGWLLPTAVVGALFIIQNRRADAYLPVLWVVLIPVFAYAPTVVQRRLVEGGWTGLVILAVMGFSHLFPGRNKYLTFYLAPTFLTGIFFIGGMFQAASAPEQPAFILRQDVDCYKEIDELAEPDEVVLTNMAAGNALPAWANVRTIVGHGPESAGKDELEPLVNLFYSGAMPSSEYEEFIRKHDVRYILLDTEDIKKNLLDPAQYPGVQLIFGYEGCRLYAVGN